MLRAVVFDIGETLIDETRHWAAWADWMGVPHLTFFGALGGVAERGEQHRVVFERLRPGFDLPAEIQKRRASGVVESWEACDLYPDARACLEALRDDGYRTAAAGNQPGWAVEALRALDLPLEMIGASLAWGTSKPDPAFFSRVADEMGLPPEQIAYVGDRLDNDVLPARAAGMFAVFVRRGPWGVAHALRPEVARADLRVEHLATLPGALRRHLAPPAESNA